MSTTKRTTTVLFLIALAGLGLLNHQQELRAKATAVQKTDKDYIIGTWRFTGLRQGGKDMPAEVAALMRVTFYKDGKVTLSLPDKSPESKFQLPKPGQIDMPFGFGDVSPGIYKFDGENRLTICLGPPGSNRPAEFSAEKDTDQVLLALQRAKPSEEKLTPAELVKYREVAERVQHQNHLKQIGLAMHNYHSVYKQFPRHAIYSKDGQTPLLSWRVALLPYLEHKDLYAQFKLDEPWDSAHNKKLIAKMPAIFETPGQGKQGDGKTHYQVFTGPDTIFDGNKKTRFADIRDGSSNTILAIEAKNPVVWTQPDDLTLPKEKDKLPTVGGLFKGGISVLFADGSVRTFRLNPDPVLLRAAVTPNGNELVDLEKLEQP